MVRTTIACAWCRRSKIKCMHDGNSPCRNCLKSDRTEQCVLSGPYDAVRPAQAAAEGSSMISSPARSKLTQHRDVDKITTSPTTLLNTNGSKPSLGEAVLDLPPQIIVEVASIFTLKFPELAFLHLPTFSSETKNWVHIAAMLALCYRLLPAGTQACLESEDEYASYARQGLQIIPSGVPTLATVQALLTMSMYEWGAGNGYGAWMYSGAATRMMQSIDAMRDRTHRQIRHDHSGVHDRTFWACFVMDRLIFCGKSQPLALPLDRMRIDMPIGEQDFAFGQSLKMGEQPPEDGPVASAQPFTTNEYYNVLIKGFEIWSKILDLITSGGRRLPKMSKPENCPWVSGSPWRILFDGLEDWRAQQSDRLQYPSTSVAVHVSLGYGEKFAFVNLLYYVSVVFLYREYIPFLPNQQSQPVGPVDPPLLESIAPEGWWTDRAADICKAADNITHILHELEMLNTPFATPFAGFCAFCAGTVHSYMAEFPKMNLNRSPDAAANAELNSQYLEKFKGLWRMGIGWTQTLKRVESLYKRANQDRARFYGKTRSDFLALDSSIHDYSGTSPPTGEEFMTREPGEQASLEIPTITDPGPDHTAAVSLQDLSSAAYQLPGNQVQESPDTAMDGIVIDNEFWSDVWPMWEEQQFLPFAIGGMPFDFNPNTDTI